MLHNTFLPFACVSYPTNILSERNKRGTPTETLYEIYFPHVKKTADVYKAYNWDKDQGCKLFTIILVPRSCIVYNGDNKNAYIVNVYGV